MVSPSIHRASRTFRVYSLFGWRFVSAKAAEVGRKNAQNAGYWFSKLGVHGNSNMVEKIKRMRDLELGDELLRDALRSDE